MLLTASPLLPRLWIVVSLAGAVSCVLSIAAVMAVRVMAVINIAAKGAMNVFFEDILFARERFVLHLNKFYRVLLNITAPHSKLHNTHRML